MRALFLIFCFWIELCSVSAQQASDVGWPEYGGNSAGQRFSKASQITPGNVSRVKVAWTFHTHAFEQANAVNSHAAFEATPVLWKSTLYFDTPFDQVFAVDAVTGKLKWTFDPKISREKLFIVTSRGVALWHAPRPGKGLCEDTTVLVATLDRRLIALDAGSGTPCPGFGDKGSVDLSRGVEIASPELYFFTSPAAIVGNTVVLGSSVADNQQIFAASGATRGFDARTGRQLWSWEPLPWIRNQHPKRSGSGNAWAPLAADPEHDLVFLPTGSPSPDYFGGARPGENRDADSLVALRASSGEKVWAFQLVHHDLWDYDGASQPLLFSFRGNTPAIAVTNKTGMIYVFNRLTGEPLYPIKERPVPKSTLLGEVTWPTQPFSSLPPLLPLRYSADDLAGSAADKSFCRTQMSELRYEGLFTPPSESGSLIFPAALGGPNWGSSALDVNAGIMFTRVSALPYRLRMELARPELLPLAGRVNRKWNHKAPAWLGGEPAAERLARTGPDALHGSVYRPPDMGLGHEDASLMVGSPWSMRLKAIVSPSGVPCAPEPFGRIVATDLNTGKQLWSVPHGQMVRGGIGSIGTGGLIVTASGLIFLSSSNDPYLRAYRSSDGQEVWKAGLPATANATPMTYQEKGRQYLVLAVGGHRLAEHDESDLVIAFALPAKVGSRAHPSRK